MKIIRTCLILVIVILALAGCKKAEEPTPAASAANANPPADGAPGMDKMETLILGTLKLEGTPDAVTPERARSLLPLWQLIQGGSLKSDAEIQAVLKQIEGEMTDAQLAAIEAMQLTADDMRTWMEEQGMTFPQDGAPGGQGGPGAFQNLSEEERTRMREEFQNLDPEARATRMAEMGLQQPGGGQGQNQNPDAMDTNRPQGGGGRMGISSFLIQPLIALLTERAAQ